MSINMRFNGLFGSTLVAKVGDIISIPINNGNGYTRAIVTHISQNSFTGDYSYHLYVEGHTLIGITPNMHQNSIVLTGNQIRSLRNRATASSVLSIAMSRDNPFFRESPESPVTGFFKPNIGRINIGEHNPLFRTDKTWVESFELDRTKRSSIKRTLNYNNIVRIINNADGVEYGILLNNDGIDLDGITFEEGYTYTEGQRIIYPIREGTHPSATLLMAVNPEDIVSLDNKVDIRRISGILKRANNLDRAIGGGNSGLSSKQDIRENIKVRDDFYTPRYSARNARYIISNNNYNQMGYPLNHKTDDPIDAIKHALREVLSQSGDIDDIDKIEDELTQLSNEIIESMKSHPRSSLTDITIDNIPFSTRALNSPHNFSLLYPESIKRLDVYDWLDYTIGRKRRAVTQIPRYRRQGRGLYAPKDIDNFYQRSMKRVYEQGGLPIGLQEISRRILNSISPVELPSIGDDSESITLTRGVMSDPFSDLTGSPDQGEYLANINRQVMSTSDRYTIKDKDILDFMRHKRGLVRGNSIPNIAGVPLPQDMEDYRLLARKLYGIASDDNIARVAGDIRKLALKSSIKGKFQPLQLKTEKALLQDPLGSVGSHVKWNGVQGVIQKIDTSTPHLQTTVRIPSINPPGGIIHTTLDLKAGQTPMDSVLKALQRIPETNEITVDSVDNIPNTFRREHFMLSGTKVKIEEVIEELGLSTRASTSFGQKGYIKYGTFVDRILRGLSNIERTPDEIADIVSEIKVHALDILYNDSTLNPATLMGDSDSIDKYLENKVRSKVLTSLQGMNRFNTTSLVYLNEDGNQVVLDPATPPIRENFSDFDLTVMPELSREENIAYKIHRSGEISLTTDEINHWRSVNANTKNAYLRSALAKKKLLGMNKELMSGNTIFLNNLKRTGRGRYNSLFKELANFIQESPYGNINLNNRSNEGIESLITAFLSHKGINDSNISNRLILGVLGAKRMPSSPQVFNAVSSVLPIIHGARLPSSDNLESIQDLLASAENTLRSNLLKDDWDEHIVDSFIYQVFGQANREVSSFVNNSLENHMDNASSLLSGVRTNLLTLDDILSRYNLNRNNSVLLTESIHNLTTKRHNLGSILSGLDETRIGMIERALGSMTGVSSEIGHKILSILNNPDMDNSSKAYHIMSNYIQMMNVLPYSLIDDTRDNVEDILSALVGNNYNDHRIGISINNLDILDKFNDELAKTPQGVPLNINDTTYYYRGDKVVLPSIKTDVGAAKNKHRRKFSKDPTDEPSIGTHGIDNTREVYVVYDEAGNPHTLGSSDHTIIVPYKQLSRTSVPPTVTREINHIPVYNIDNQFIGSDQGINNLTRFNESLAAKKFLVLDIEATAEETGYSVIGETAAVRYKLDGENLVAEEHVASATDAWVSNISDPEKAAYVKNQISKGEINVLKNISAIGNADMEQELDSILRIAEFISNNENKNLNIIAWGNEADLKKLATRAKTYLDRLSVSRLDGTLIASGVNDELWTRLNRAYEVLLDATNNRSIDAMFLHRLSNPSEEFALGKVFNNLLPPGDTVAQTHEALTDIRRETSTVLEKNIPIYSKISPDKISPIEVQKLVDKYFHHTGGRYNRDLAGRTLRVSRVIQSDDQIVIEFIDPYNQIRRSRPMSSFDLAHELTYILDEITETEYNHYSEYKVNDLFEREIRRVLNPQLDTNNQVILRHRTLSRRFEYAQALSEGRIEDIKSRLRVGLHPTVDVNLPDSASELSWIENYLEKDARLIEQYNKHRGWFENIYSKIDVPFFNRLEELTQAHNLSSAEAMMLIRDRYNIVYGEEGLIKFTGTKNVPSPEWVITLDTGLANNYGIRVNKTRTSLPEALVRTAQQYYKNDSITLRDIYKQGSRGTYLSESSINSLLMDPGSVTLSFQQKESIAQYMLSNNIPLGDRGSLLKILENQFGFTTSSRDIEEVSNQLKEHIISISSDPSKAPWVTATDYVLKNIPDNLEEVLTIQDEMLTNIALNPRERISEIEEELFKTDAAYRNRVLRFTSNKAWSKSVNEYLLDNNINVIGKTPQELLDRTVGDPESQSKVKWFLNEILKTESMKGGDDAPVDINIRQRQEILRQLNLPTHVDVDNEISHIIKTGSVSDKAREYPIYFRTTSITIGELVDTSVDALNLKERYPNLPGYADEILTTYFDTIGMTEAERESFALVGEGLKLPIPDKRDIASRLPGVIYGLPDSPIVSPMSSTSAAALPPPPSVPHGVVSSASTTAPDAISLASAMAGTPVPGSSSKTMFNLLNNIGGGFSSYGKVAAGVFALLGSTKIRKRDRILEEENNIITPIPELLSNVKLTTKESRMKNKFTTYSIQVEVKGEVDHERQYNSLAPELENVVNQSFSAPVKSNTIDNTKSVHMTKEMAHRHAAELLKNRYDR